MLVAVESLRKCFPSLPIAPNERRSMVATPCSYSTNIWKIVDGLVRFLTTPDVRENVERPLRLVAVDAVDRVQEIDHDIAPLLELRGPRRDDTRVLGALERLPPRLLDKRGRTGNDVDIELSENHRLFGTGKNRVPEPPAGHRVRFRMTAHHDRSFPHSGLRHDALMVLSVEDDVLVNLVGVDPDVGPGLLADDSGDILEIVERQNAARRVRRGVDNEHFRSGRDEPLDVSGVEAEVLRLLEVERDRFGADKGHPGLVDREPRARVDHFIAGVHVGHHGVRDRGLCPGRHHDLPRVDLDPPRAFDLTGNRLAQPDDPLRVGIVRVPRLDVLDRDVVDVVGAVEIRLAEIQPDDLQALLLASPDVVANLEGIFRPEIVDAICKRAHEITPG
jgi:hypothetical protein